MTSSIQRTEQKDVISSVLNCLTSSSEERRQCEIELERWEESKRQGMRLCEKIAKRLEEKGGLKFRSNLDRLYFDETFSFEALKCGAKGNSDKLDVWIRIKPRNVDQTDDAQPSLFGTTAAFEIGEQSRELKLDVLGECVLEGLEPGVLCCLTSLKTSFSNANEVLSAYSSDKVSATLQNMLEDASDASETLTDSENTKSKILTIKSSKSRVFFNWSIWNTVASVLLLISGLSVTLVPSSYFDTRLIKDDGAVVITRPYATSKEKKEEEDERYVGSYDAGINFTDDYTSKHGPCAPCAPYEYIPIFEDIRLAEEERFIEEICYTEIIATAKRLAETRRLVRSPLITERERFEEFCALENFYEEAKRLVEKMNVTKKQLFAKTKRLAKELRFLEGENPTDEERFDNEDNYIDENEDYEQELSVSPIEGDEVPIEEYFLSQKLVDNLTERLHIEKKTYSKEERFAKVERLADELRLIGEERLEEEERVTELFTQIKSFADKTRDVKETVSTSLEEERLIEAILLAEGERLTEEERLEGLSIRLLGAATEASEYMPKGDFTVFSSEYDDVSFSEYEAEWNRILELLSKASEYSRKTRLAKENHFVELFVNDELLAKSRRLFNESNQKAPWKAGGRTGIRRELDISGTRYGFCWIPPGSFVRETFDDEEGDLERDSQDRVSIERGFWMLETPVTQKLWTAIMGRNPSYFSSFGAGAKFVSDMDTSNFPVECVSWNDCQIFIEKLNNTVLASSDMKFRLPTENEWEYACRAGTESPYWQGEKLLTGWANYDDQRNSYEDVQTDQEEQRTEQTVWEEQRQRHTCAVKSYDANPWGLYDVHGNVWEWVADRYVYYFEEATPPIETTNVSPRILRGGSWNSSAGSCRSSNRGHDDPRGISYDAGFRFILCPSK